MKTLFIASVFAISGILNFSKPITTIAEEDAIVGKWLNQEGTSHIQILKVGNKFYGKIVWLKEPNKNGKPKVDELNQDPKKQSLPLLGLVILNGFTYDSSDKEWGDGTIYDPKNGKTYSSFMKLDGEKLNIRGYIGISLFGRTGVWTRVQ